MSRKEAKVGHMYCPSIYFHPEPGQMQTHCIRDFATQGPHVPQESRGYLACLELPWRLLLSPICPTEPLSTLQQHSAASSLPLFTAHMLKSHLGKRLCSTKELILTRFHVSLTPFCTTVATTSAPSATGPALEDRNFIQKVCSQTG